MNFLFIYISAIWTFWFVRQEKIALFYIYLWQLKEYHWGRFIDHFRTEKGKRLIFHPLKITKILVFFSYWPLARFGIASVWLALIFTIYAVEFFIALRDWNNKTLKKPVFTLKTWFFTSIISFIFLAILIYTFILEIALTGFIIGIPLTPILALLLIDILSPIIVSVIILLFQPPAVIYRLIAIIRAKRKRLKFKDLIVIGITGSYGKTSTKEFLKTILEQKFRVLVTEEHQNSEIAIARCILNDLKPEHQIFICEMGAYDKGKIRQVANVVQPQIGVITGVNEQHLALFGSMENLMSAEGGRELAESLPQNGVIILNGNNETIRNTKYKIRNTKYCSTNEKIDIWAKNITVEKEWLYFSVCDKAGDSADFKINLVGKHNIENILLAAAVAKELGMFLSEITVACKKIKPGQGAMKLLKREGSADIIDSSYSANPDGVTTSLEHLKLWFGKKVVIMPCLIELGKASGKIHFEIGKKIGKTCNLAIIVTKDKFKEIKEGAIASNMKPENILFLENPKQIFEKVKKFYLPDSVILLEGKLPKALLKFILK